MFGRQSTGVWIDPSGQVHEVKQHAPFAYDELMKMYQGEASAKTFQVNPETGKGENKGQSGDVAKSMAEGVVGSDRESPQNTLSLVKSGWIHGRVSPEGSAFWLASADALPVAWPAIDRYLQQGGNVTIGVGTDPSSLQEAVIDRSQISSEAEAAIKDVMRILQPQSNDRSGGTGWTGHDGEIKYFRP